MLPRHLCIKKDIIVLGGPAVPRPPTIIVCPDNFIQKCLSPKNIIQKKLAVMHFSVVNVKVKGAVRGQHPVCFS
jgi:hypothetical protein